MQVNTPNTPAEDLIWGATEIAKAIGRTERAVFRMLENNTLPGATRVGRRWVLSKKHFYAGTFEKAVA